MKNVQLAAAVAIALPLPYIPAVYVTAYNHTFTLNEYFLYPVR